MNPLAYLLCLVMLASLLVGCAAGPARVCDLSDPLACHDARNADRGVSRPEPAVRERPAKPDKPEKC